ncbi:tyrosine-protein phosphatase [Metabacillus fastidiosus]|uniref:tyrosine-protein phosphatase n=1 Tax=Metabacillus fastidiosus TaxID=1458 RepID=UPI003D2C3F5B
MLKQFDKLYNFRDIGGYRTKDGSCMKSGVLFRSDQLSKLSESDTEKLKQLDIKLICDLRTQKEHQSKPAKMRTNDTLKIVNIPIQQYETQDANRMKLLSFLFRKSGEEQFDHFIRDYYRRITFERTSQVNEILSLVAEEKNLPAIIHCTAGKDRTGIISAIIQLLVGISYEKVQEDYLLTNQYYGPRLSQFIKVMRWISLFQVSPERTKYILEAKPEYLDEVYNDMLRQYGSIETYLSEACQIDRCMIDRLKNQLLE